jgi:hypothetical protein
VGGSVTVVVHEDVKEFLTDARPVNQGQSFEVGNPWTTYTSFDCLGPDRQTNPRLLLRTALVPLAIITLSFSIIAEISACRTALLEMDEGGRVGNVNRRERIIRELNDCKAGDSE